MPAWPQAQSSHWPGPVAPLRTSSLLGLQLEENRAQVSQGLESDGLCLGIEVCDFSSCLIPYPLGSCSVLDSPELAFLSDLVLQTGLLIFVHKAPVLPTGGKNGRMMDGRKGGLMWVGIGGTREI